MKVAQILMAIVNLGLAAVSIMGFIHHFHDDTSVLYVAALGWFISEFMRYTGLLIAELVR